MSLLRAVGRVLLKGAPVAGAVARSSTVALSTVRTSMSSASFTTLSSSIACSSRSITSKVSTSLLPASGTSSTSFTSSLPITFNAVPVRSFHVKRVKSRRTKLYRLKTHKATEKRFDVTATGKIMRWKIGKRHLMRKKSPRQLRRMDNRVKISKVHYKKYRRSLPWAF